MSAPSLTLQLLTVSVISLQRQTVHNRLADRTTWNSTYDYVVVGAGTSGAIVAARLTEDPTVRVLLLEAGGPATVITDMLAQAWNGMVGENDWGYLTTPQRNAGFAFRNHRIVYPRGRVMGGSSTTNYAIYNRGNRRDYDNWAQYYGLTSWSYDNVLPYFLRTENNTNAGYVRMATQYHNTSGQMQISSAPNPDPILLHYMTGWNRQGVPYTDFNGPNQFGTTLIQQAVTNTNWTRQSTSNAFLIPALGRDNLHVLGRAHVTQVLLRNNTMGDLEAYGVEFVRANQTYTVYASSEVILSAGAVNTPQILMLSGIGPRDHLEDLNITVEVDLPVGNDLQDHILLPMDYLAKNESDIQWSRDLANVMTEQNMYAYFAENTGPLIQLPVVLTYASSRFNDEPGWNDGIMATLTDQIGENLEELTALNANQQAWIDYYRPLVNDQRHFYVFYALYRPRSRGTVRLNSTDPFDPPLVDPNFFGEPHDLAVIVDVMSRGMAMAEGPYFSRYASIYDRPIPGCTLCRDRPMHKCYSYLACVAQTITATSYHPTCSARMGNSTDTGAVLNEQLQVRGVQGLRVIDASIMPKVVNANTNAAVMMIGEKGAELVRQSRQNGTLTMMAVAG